VPVLSFTITKSDTGSRLDTVVVTHIPALSRSGAKRLIRDGHITVNGQVKKPGYLTRTGDLVRADIPSRDSVPCEPEPIPLSILYEDGHVIVVDKPPGIVVHPGAGHLTGTLVNALLFHCPDLQGLGDPLRPGIVHRLDKDTSGCLVVAKSELAYEDLRQQFSRRKVVKAYLALVYGRMKAPAGLIDLPIGRHPRHRTRMSTKSHRARASETHWKVREEVAGMTFLEIDLKTGRTHQVRVHCAAMGHPVVGDARYGRKRKWKGILAKETLGTLAGVGRQLLHAWRLTFAHPETGKLMHFESPLPEDMASVLDALRHPAHRAP
jgi:23S rRNA pseudouridine1911/1915/1917 synthase